MPLRFRCSNCRHFLSIGRRKAGTEIACPVCRYLQKVPELANPEPPIISGLESAAKSRRAVESATRLVNLTLALAMLGFLGWLLWMFPRPSPQPSGQGAPNEEQLASLAQINPLLQPEIEVSPRNAPALLPSPIPPPPAPSAAAKKRPSEPLPVAERHPPGRY